MGSVGVDVGGTFTDFYVVDEDKVLTFKLPTTPHDPSEAVLRGLMSLRERGGPDVSELDEVLHGTTVATNAIIQRRGSRIALITTKGFGDVLEYGRLRRPPEALYDIGYEKPPALVPRYLIFEVAERIEADGKVLTPLLESEVTGIVDQLRNERIETVAVSLLFAFRNPAHEARICALVREQLPGVWVYASNEVLPEIGEFERTSTTTISAYIGHGITKYTERLTEGTRKPLYVMQSNGGLTTIDVIRRNPAALVSSGPAAGVVAAVAVGKAAGEDDIVAVDMGGTSCDVSLVSEGQPVITNEKKIDRYPLVVPLIDIQSIGAGGGSVAWLDSGKGLRVGPRSAGAVPGPACYGRGGDEATVTDANLMLGLLSPKGFAGGMLILDEDRGRTALERLGRTVAMDPIEVAFGIRRIVNSNMAGAIRLVTVKRGRDPRKCVLMAFGGGGPVHAADLADELGIPRVLIPPHPGITCAYGLTLADLVHDYGRSVVANLEEIIPGDLEHWLQILEAHGFEDLKRDGIDLENHLFVRSVDLRYRGQGYYLNTLVPATMLEGEAMNAIAQSFHQQHHRIYGFSQPEIPVVLVNVRVRAIGLRPKPRTDKMLAWNSGNSAHRLGIRKCLFETRIGFIDTGIYDRTTLLPGIQVMGPSIIEQGDTTTVIPPSWVATVDGGGNLILRRE